MSHPNNLSDEYPCQGDTWRKKGFDYLTVTGVTGNGVIYYMDGIQSGNFSKTKANLTSFKLLLERHGFGVPDHCTDRWYRTYGVF